MAENSNNKLKLSAYERKAIRKEIIELNKSRIKNDRDGFISSSYAEYVQKMKGVVDNLIDRKTFDNFFSQKTTTPNPVTAVQLCKHFLGMSYPEWLKEQKKNYDNENRCEYNPVYHWTGIKSFRIEKDPPNIIQEISNRIEKINKKESDKKESIKEIWLYGTHFMFSLLQKEAEYRKILKNGYSLRFLINDYRKDEVIDLIAKKFKEDYDTIEDNCWDCIKLIIRLMHWWKESKLDKKSDTQIETFSTQYSHQIQVRLHGNVASSKCYIVNPENEESISYIFPGVDRNKYDSPPVFTCKNNPGGLVKANYLPGIKEIWDESRTLSLQDIQALDDRTKKRIDLDILNFYPRK